MAIFIDIFCIGKRTKLLILVTTVYHLQLKQCKCLHVTLHMENQPVTLASFLCINELAIRNTEAYRFNSAYHDSWSFACAELALRGLNSARSLWHDMRWDFACALCLVCTELVVSGVKSGWLLQVAFYATLIPLGLEGVWSKWLPNSQVLISAMHDRVWVKGRQTLDMAAIYA